MKTFNQLCQIARLHKQFNYETIHGYLNMMIRF